MTELDKAYSEDAGDAGSSGQLVLTGEDIPYGAYQAIYHKLTNKVEKINRQHDEPRFLTFDDIKQLHLRLVQLIEPLPVKGCRVEITHVLKESYSQTFSSFDKFSLSADFTSPECTSSINYEFDFLIVLPSNVDAAKNIAQRYKLSVNASQDYIATDDIRLPYFIRELGHVGGISSQLEYSNYAVAQSIDATVENWFKTLRKREASSFMRFLMSVENPVSQFADTATRSAAFIAGALYLSENETTPARAASMMLFCLALGFASYSVVFVFARRFYKSVRRFAPSSTILLTEGDKGRHAELEKVKSKTKAFMLFLVSTVVLALCINILAAVIYNWLFPV